MEISRITLSFEELLNANHLPIEIKDKVNQGMIEILMDKMRRYSGGDSSLSKERTQSLMDSIIYTLSFYFSSMETQKMQDMLQYQDISKIYEQSHNFILQQVHTLYLKVVELQKYIVDIPLQVYQETLGTGLTAFFDAYNFDYCTQDIILTLDYPTCRPLQKNGLEKMLEYVSYLEIEHYFLHCFEISDIEKVIVGYCYYEKDMIDNISLLFINQILIKRLLGDYQELLFKDKQEIDKIYVLLKNCLKEEIYQSLYTQLTMMVNSLSTIYRQEIFSYYSYIIDDLASLLFQHCQFQTLDKAVACAF